MANRAYEYHESGNYNNIPNYLKYITKKHDSKIAFKFMVNKKDVEKTRQKILEGKYWEKNDDIYDSIDKLICSSNYIFISIFILFLICLL
jgi:hypothetical protein